MAIAIATLIAKLIGTLMALEFPLTNWSA